MRRTRTSWVIVSVLVGFSACNQIAGTEAGIPYDAVTPPAECATTEDCSAACRTATCEAGHCVFTKVASGTPASEQIQGDCTMVVCDDEGEPTSEPQVTDVPDVDECTEVECAGTEPQYTLKQACRIKQVAAGLHHTCALSADGRVKCWGDNTHGQLGLEDTSWRGDAEGQMGTNLGTVNLGLTQDESVSTIVAGENHTCALLSTRLIKCWGYNEYGQLGVGDYDDRGDDRGEMGAALLAVAVPPSYSATKIAAGGTHTCALLKPKIDQVAGEKVICWGQNNHGQLGQGNKANQPAPPLDDSENPKTVNLDGSGDTATHIIAGHGYTCALRTNKKLRCWGQNSMGQLGICFPSSEDVGLQSSDMGGALPDVDVNDIADDGVVAGYNHTCVRTQTEDNVQCWGHNYYGQLGVENTYDVGDFASCTNGQLPLKNASLGGVVGPLTAGGDHTCALLGDGSIKCWGANGSGQLGLADTDSRGDGLNEMGSYLEAVKLGTEASVGGVVAGVNHTCAWLTDGIVKCWGDNSAGQLGLGDTLNRGDAPHEMGDNLPTVKIFSNSL